MPLQAGTRLGPYEVVRALGAGGMGAVYEARDTRLDRQVAVKVLAPELASDPDFRARFTLEARAISSLNHPHICGLFDVGREHDTEYLVLELLTGETLAARIDRGPLPLAQVLTLGIEIADALEMAHRHGIVHRDLKPANIMLTGSGTKLLDFGIAKRTAGPPGQPFSVPATSEWTGTAQGTIIGTLQYMAPEQVQGAPADARTDIFAFGSILHEMATGRRAFEATTQASLAAKILESEVPPVSTLSPIAPPVFDHIVQGCLAKDPADRWQTAHDVKLQLQWIQAQSARPEVASMPAAAVRRAWVPWSVAALACGLVITTALMLLSRRSPLDQRPARLEIVMPSHMRIDSIQHAEISPDGQRIVLSAFVQGQLKLFIRDLASLQVTALGDIEAGLDPFWSPDSQSIGFFMWGRLKRVGIAGGPAKDLADAKGRKVGDGATWGRGVILFASGDGSILQVPDTGGTADAVATLPWAAGKRAFESPRFLPDGRRFLVTEVGAPASYLASLDAPGLQKLPQDGSRCIYAAGHLLFFRGAGAYARRFNPARVEFTGPEVLLAESADFLSTSDAGTVLYGLQHTASSRLTWFARGGRPTAHVGEIGEYSQMVLSPSGRRAAVVQRDPRGDRRADLVNVDLATGFFSKLTTHPAADTDPAWAPDEQRVAFTSFRSGTAGVYVKDLISGAEEPLVVRDDFLAVDEWTPDGKFIIFHNLGRAVWSVALSGDRTPTVLVDTPDVVEDEVHVSPNGRWVAYNADVSGGWQVYVAKFPEFTEQRQISGSGGVQPQWRADGRELFYLTLDGSLMVVPFETATGSEGRKPSLLFVTPFEPSPYLHKYAVSSDGARVLGLERMAGDRASLVVLFNGLTTLSGATPQ
jgi:eukaryotic-like serine/threonine-protein kinase